MLSFTDIASPYARLTHSRSYNNKVMYDGPNGWNWFVPQMPYVVQSGTSIAVVFDPNYPLWFDDNSGSYEARFGATKFFQLTHDSGDQSFTLVQSRNGSTITTVFNDFSSLTRPGKFRNQTDTSGVETSIQSTSGSEITELQSLMTVDSTDYYGSLVYTYYSSGANVGKLESVLYRRKTGSAGSWVNVKKYVYTYHDGSDSNGNLNDLKTATEQHYDDSSSTWEEVACSYYRYYVDDASGTGFQHGLKIELGPEAYRLAFNDGVDFDTASDSTLMDYADHYFEYDSSKRVTKEIAAVCESCPGGGTTTDTFAYDESSFDDNYNAWKYKTIQTLPNAATLTVYSNYVGAPILHVYTDGSDEWYRFWRYNGNCQVIVEAESSAITGYSEAYEDLVNYSSNTYIKSSAGLLYTTDYYSGSGTAEGLCAIP